MNLARLRPNLSASGIAAPLRVALFRRIWLASLVSNLGLLIQGVGAAWAMTEMTTSADMVALVQTALMLPVMLLATPAGAIADMYDRRVVTLVSLCISLGGSTILAVLAALHLISPAVLLAFCFMVGCGAALFGPAWQSSVAEQVPSDTLPAAIALNGISYNIARSFGPAVGGIIVAAAGAVAAFVINALTYIPLLVVLYLWKRVQQPSRLPPERLGRAIVSGFRYILNSPSIRIVLTRTIIIAIAGGSLFALMPLIARDLLGGTAQTFGVMLGAFGIGGVLGALNVAELRKRASNEQAIRICAMLMGIAIALAAISRSSALTAVALVLAGIGWLLMVSTLNIVIQLAVPRWVSGRSLAAFQAAVAGGIATGSWVWGHLANVIGVEGALLCAAALMFLSPLAGLWLRVPSTGGGKDISEPLADPEVQLALTARSGPIVIEIEYRIDPANARAFYRIMQEVQLARQRNGAYGWSIARDLSDPELWTERYHCPTWHDYLRQRNRPTVSERALQDRAGAFHMGLEPIRIRRMLERPFGSVRYRDDSPDPARRKSVTVTPGAGGT